MHLANEAELDPESLVSFRGNTYGQRTFDNQRFKVGDTVLVIPSTYQHFKGEVGRGESNFNVVACTVLIEGNQAVRILAAL